MDVSGAQIMAVPLGTSAIGPTLLIMTGTAHMMLPLLGPRNDDNMVRETFTLDLSEVYGNRLFNPATTRAIASASLASIKGTSDADEMTWAVDQASADIQLDFRLRLRAAVAVQGSGGLVLRVAYQTFVQTMGLPLLRFITSPSTLFISPNATGAFNLIGTLAADPTGGGTQEPVGFSSDVAGLMHPPSILVTPGSSFTQACTIQPGTLDSGETQTLAIVASTAANSLTATIKVTQL